jgi:hypothetical protein
MSLNQAIKVLGSGGGLGLVYLGLKLPDPIGWVVLTVVMIGLGWSWLWRQARLGAEERAAKAAADLRRVKVERELSKLRNRGG